MPNYLGPMKQCVSHVNTRLRYVQKLTETSGSLNREQIIEFSVSQRVSVEDVPINLNAPNGVYIENDLESGVDLLQQIERLFVANAK
jgi:hypothetical protein